MMKREKPIIAIDGPVGAGKSTTARKVAVELGFLYVDTGAMYRAVTLDVLSRGIDPGDEDGVRAILPSITVEIPFEGGTWRIVLNGVDVTERIRDLDVTRAVSAVSAMKAVRDKMTDIQRSLGKNGGIVMEGRDIGTVVFTDAEFKFYIDAAVEVRARRRHKELAEKGIDISFGELAEEIRERDRANMERTIAPLRKADDAIVIDTSGMTFDEQVRAITSIVKGVETVNDTADEPIKQVSRWYWIARFILYILYRIVFRLSYEGTEHIPREGGVMIASNHASFLDPPAIGVAAPRPVSFLAKKELDAVPLVKQLLAVSHSIPIDREGYSKGTLTQVIEHLKKGRAVIVFPEGTRTKTGEFGKAKAGAGLIAVKAGVPVVPCWIEGTYRAKPFLTKITVHFLPPLYPNTIVRGTKKEDYLLVSEKIMCDIIKLSQTHHGRA